MLYINKFGGKPPKKGNPKKGGSFYATRVAVKFALLKVKGTPSEITHVISRPPKTEGQ